MAEGDFPRDDDESPDLNHGADESHLPNIARPESPTPPSLNYAERRASARRRMTPEDRREFRAALVAGSACSLVFWTLVFSGMLGNAAPALAVLFVVSKMSVTMVLFYKSGGTPAGLGVLLSMGIASLILIGTCFAEMSRSVGH